MRAITIVTKTIPAATSVAIENACIHATRAASATVPASGPREADVFSAVASEVSRLVFTEPENLPETVAMLLTYTALRMAPNNATPSEQPSSRVVSFIAEPIPERFFGTDAMRMFVLGVIARLTPVIMTIIVGSMPR
jgi:hypothetical protein